MRGDDILDTAYIVFWRVSLDENRNVTEVELSRSMEMAKVSKNEQPIFTDHRPSDLYIERAINQIKNLDWSSWTPSTREASATSYLYRSRPDDPASSNDQQR